jgi:hypothetical protein
MKLTERFHRIDHDHLQIDFTIDDPKFYTALWPIRYHYDLKANWEIGEAYCIPEDEQEFLKQNVPETKEKPASDASR